jgi:hypothetical protein
VPASPPLASHANICSSHGHVDFYGGHCASECFKVPLHRHESRQLIDFFQARACISVELWIFLALSTCTLSVSCARSVVVHAMLLSAAFLKAIYGNKFGSNRTLAHYEQKKAQDPGVRLKTKNKISPLFTSHECTNTMKAPSMDSSHARPKSMSSARAEHLGMIEYQAVQDDICNLQSTDTLETQEFSRRSACNRAWLWTCF